MNKGKLVLGLAIVMTTTGLVAPAMQAAVRHPHPTFPDIWKYGITKRGYAYSQYWLKAPIRLGSSASITDAWGNLKAKDRANYGWAYAGAQKKWYWGTAKAFYGWYRF
ncbi:hypothetical protein [Weissella halotolerans]|uniref:Bacteriocin n=1 Tax=Weissella halotolerans DSM 20190 TaxID=1123500 RepID=A0A0R2FVK3_9LACO|nr:hypothetical protein [Weissella halotolerans]KRN32415.1 hypothetical protein IV68_GL000767 [Weissella halotolerans DSM 20190]